MIVGLLTITGCGNNKATEKEYYGPYDPVAVDRNSVKTMNAFEVEFGSVISFSDISGNVGTIMDRENL